MGISAEKTVARPDVTVKIDKDVYRIAKMVASARGIHLAQYLSEIVGPIAQRDLEVETQKALLKAKQPKPKKGVGK